MNDLEKIIRDIPSQVKTKLGIENKDKLVKNQGSIVVCGMGGSGVVGDLLKGILTTLDIHVHKDYGLPQNIDDNSLFIIISYSGNTKETLSSYEEAKNKKVVVISGAGELLELAKENKTPHIKVPWDKDIPTRFNIGHLLGAALELLNEEIYPVRDREGPQRASISNGMDEMGNMELENEELAEELNNKTVLIYTPSELAGLGLFWKEALNETAKLAAFTNTLPEASHNEIESISSTDNKFLLFLNNSELEDLAKEKEWPHKIINLHLINSIQLALLTAVKIAQLKNISPTATPLISKNKENNK